MKEFNGKAIYNPAGKAAEYSQWACNFYVGCSNGCEYCYCKKGILSRTMGQDKPQLKKCFRDERQAMDIFDKELKQNLSDLQKHGLFFSFTTDPMLPETIGLTETAIDLATDYGIPVKILTKCVEWVDYIIPRLPLNYRNMYAFGFTLTGHDELEKGASTNAERIEAMIKLHEAGYKTFASIEPIVDFASSLNMIRQAFRSGCELFKIGLESGKIYLKSELLDFVEQVNMEFHYVDRPNGKTISPFIYWKDTLLKRAGIARESLPSNCVNRYHNMFNN